VKFVHEEAAYHRPHPRSSDFAKIAPKITFFLDRHHWNITLRGSSPQGHEQSRLEKGVARRRLAAFHG